MSEQLNRAARLKVGPKGSDGKSYFGFRVAFEIEKTNESTPNPAKISIYNLAPKTRSDLESETDLVMILEVGYLGLGDTPPVLSQIFIGDVTRVRSERNGPDMITTLEGGDAETAIRETTVDQTFSENTTTSQVIGAVAKKFKVAIGTVMPGLVGIYENGLTLTGLASDNMDVLTKKAGLEWNITDNELNILDPKLPTAELAAVVSKSTGLIGVPSKGKNGIEFKSLLNPLIKPGRAVSLISGQISGLFKPLKCRYAGDTHSGEWVVQVEAEAI